MPEMRLSRLAPLGDLEIETAVGVGELQRAFSDVVIDFETSGSPDLEVNLTRVLASAREITVVGGSRDVSLNSTFLNTEGGRMPQS